MDRDAHLSAHATATPTGSPIVPESGAAASASRIVIRRATRLDELDAVHRLTYAAFRERGFCPPNEQERLTHHPELDVDPRTQVMIALADDGIVGTLSWTVDGPGGLHTDRDFHEQTAQIRREGRRLGSAWRIATCPRCRGESAVSQALMQACVDWAVATGLQTCLFVFNPRHERFYQRMLGMLSVAQRDDSGGLTNAPAVLMRWDIERCPRRWLRD